MESSRCTVFSAEFSRAGVEKEQSHAPNQKAEKVVKNLKRIASEHPELALAQILRTEMPRVSSGVLSQFPERENLKKTMRRERANTHYPVLLYFIYILCYFFQVQQPLNIFFDVCIL